MIKNDINNGIVSKLERILSKKFRLNQEDYIILIDRFNLKNNDITRKTVTEMINLLKMQKIYEDTPTTYNKVKDTIIESQANSIESSISVKKLPSMPKEFLIDTVAKDIDVKEIYTFFGFLSFSLIYDL